MIAMPSTTVVSEPASPIGDTITLFVWAALAVSALRLVWRLPGDRRGAWRVVAVYCSVVAVDKAVDLQLAFYEFVQWSLDTLDPWLGLRQHHRFVRFLLLVPMTLVAVGSTVWLVRRDSHLDRGRKLAMAGLVLVLLLVGLRLLPGLGMLDETAGWALEGLACLLIASGMYMGWRAAAPDA